MTVLVVGGAGYIGSCMVVYLKDRGIQTVVLDDLSTGHKELIQSDFFYEGDYGNSDLVADICRRHRLDAVMHFGAKSLVSESVKKPELYFEANVIKSGKLLESLIQNDIKRFIFSSTCAIFGDPGNHAISEDLEKNPITPYGSTKLEFERTLTKAAADRGLHAIALRYFNAAGAEPKLRVGEMHEPETHLIPRVLGNAYALTKNQKMEPVDIFGTHYPTPDGTCVRDYIYVWDLAHAHFLALEKLLTVNPTTTTTGSFQTYNLGTEHGFSVREVMDACEKVVGHKFERKEQPERAGDPPRLVADSKKVFRELGFKAASSPEALTRIVSSAWEWEKIKRDRAHQPTDRK